MVDLAGCFGRRAWRAGAAAALVLAWSAGTGAAAGGAARGAASVASREMIAAANPWAARAGADILRAGGGAVDAVIAAQMVLNLVEPQSSGLGGGAFLLYFDAASGRLTSYDGRETAPVAATPDQFLRPDGTVPAFRDARVGGNAVGVPGLLRMLERAHRAHGRLPWARLFRPAIDLAERGFAVSPRLHALAEEATILRRFPDTAAYFLDRDGHARPVGARLRNPPLAESFRAIAAGGAEAFYNGVIARDVAAAVRGATVNPGRLTAADIAAYRARERAPVCLVYRGYRLCGMGPPSSGGITTLQIMGMLERFDLARHDADSVAAVHLFAEASRLAFADRDRYIADPDYVAVPVAGLLDRAYLARRAALIDPARSRGLAKAGTPPGARRGQAPAVDDLERSSTSHLSIIDRYGDAVSLTTSIESAFGSALMTHGFLLNNQLTDFSFRPVRGGRPVANRVEPGKRPRSSMAPTIVLDPGGRLFLVVGSPGGARIICYVAKTLIAVIDWQLDIQSAIALPNLCNRNGATEIESGTALAALRPALEALGHRVVEAEMTSGLHGLMVSGGALLGGADPRREGVAIGR